MILPTRYKMKPPLSAKPIKSILKKLGCVGLWVMNENGGLSVFDLSGNGHTGTITILTWTSGKFGPVLIGDGTVGSTVALYAANSDKIFTGLTKWTAGGWVYATTIEANNSPFFGNLGVDTPITVRLVDSGGGVFKFQCYAHTGGGFYINDLRTLTTIVANTWYHLVLVYDGSTTFRIYVNGVLDNTGACTAGITQAECDGVVGIFGDPVGASADEWKGMVDIPFVYNRVSSASEIAQLYRKPFYMFGRKRTIVTVPALPPEVSALYMDLTSQIWTIKHSKGLFTKL